MAINFDELPHDKPVGRLLEPGFYKAHIADAVMKTSKAGNAYLNVTLDLTNDAGVKGKLWVMLFDSDKQLPCYQLQRFIAALNLNLTGAFELKDLIKIIMNKNLVVDVGVDEQSSYGAKNTVEVFKNEIYYPISAWAALTGGAEVSQATKPISAADALDATVEDEAIY